MIECTAQVAAVIFKCDFAASNNFAMLSILDINGTQVVFILHNYPLSNGHSYLWQRPRNIGLPLLQVIAL
jgi:hypothetical protein